MDLTIKEIKSKQNKLEENIKNLLKEFYKETNVSGKCVLNFGDVAVIAFKYDNPFDYDF